MPTGTAAVTGCGREADSRAATAGTLERCQAPTWHRPATNLLRAVGARHRAHTPRSGSTRSSARMPTQSQAPTRQTWLVRGWCLVGAWHGRQRNPDERIAGLHWHFRRGGGRRPPYWRTHGRPTRGTPKRSTAKSKRTRSESRALKLCAARGWGPCSWSSRWVVQKRRRRRGKERGKRVKETQRGALATRKPRRCVASFGEPKPRPEEHALWVSLAQEPPRCTRYDPDPGPVGFVCGSDV